MYTLPEANSSHLKIGHPKRKRIVFQPSIFRCENVSFRQGNKCIIVKYFAQEAFVVFRCFLCSSLEKRTFLNFAQPKTVLNRRFNKKNGVVLTVDPGQIWPREKKTKKNMSSQLVKISATQNEGQRGQSFEFKTVSPCCGVKYSNLSDGDVADDG